MDSAEIFQPADMYMQQPAFGAYVAGTLRTQYFVIANRSSIEPNLYVYIINRYQFTNRADSGAGCVNQGKDVFAPFEQGSGKADMNT